MITRRTLANAIRALSMDAVQKANSGHPGMPMGMSDIAEVLWNDFLKHNPKNPNWFNRDRFILSNGHGSMLQYALLHLTGYDLSIEDIQQFRQLHSKTPGHPEYRSTPGVETTTGPLGQGFANAVGMALAEAILGAHFNKGSENNSPINNKKDNSISNNKNNTDENNNHNIIDHYTYCFVGDGCLMEGISHEAASIAGTLGLGKLITFWDNNGISIDGEVAGWFLDDTPKRFEAYHWHVIADVDGHDSEAIKRAIIEAQNVTDKPSLICCKTIIGFGAPNLAGTAKTHGAPLGEKEVASARTQLDWPYKPFEIPKEIYAAWNATDKGENLEKAWQKKFAAYQNTYPDLAKDFLRRLQHELPTHFMEKMSVFIQTVEKNQEAIATRKASLNTLNLLTEMLPELLGGSADLSESNLTFAKHSKTITPHHFEGNYIFYGVREFAMTAIMSGLYLHGGFIPYGGTFLVFLDYARNAVRLSALMGCREIFVYTHDSIGLGEDGPTHQPIEHLSILRNTPNMSLWRPADATETAVAWQMAILRKDGPTSLALTRQVVPHLEKTAAQIANIARGGYILLDVKNFDAIIIATGSEVSLALSAALKLNESGFKIRVVSMPSTDVFLSQDTAYQEMVLPKAIITRVAVEAAASNYWYQWVGLEGLVIGCDRFGESAPGKEVFKALHITVEDIVVKVKKFLIQNATLA